MAATGAAEEEFPDIKGGGSLIVAWQLKDKPVTIVGGGSVATSRVSHLLAADARITVVCPQDGLSPELRHRLSRSQITHIPRPFSISTDLPSEGPSRPAMVLVAIDSPSVSTEIYTACHALHIPVNVADVPRECDFYFGSMYRDGPLQVMVSTNGNGPKMASIVRKRIESEIGDEPFGCAIERLGVLRAAVRQRIPGHEKAEMRKRMRWVSLLSEKWTIAQLATLDDRTINLVLEDLDQDPPSFQEIQKKL
ncbi:putative NAD(P)-binding-domain-containing protein [Myxozyma melibiosi]|uniref:precorrin-2 dehydrogenase n=1 Tax=Myxozyma melibiosi TaxID=54550 RepID=A0ABR1FBV3_9ASCO